MRIPTAALSVAAAALTAVAGPAPARAGDAQLAALVDKADLIYRGATSAAVLKMEIKTASYTRNYDIVSWDDSRKGDRALVKILGPALWRGFGTLKLGDSLELYDPKTNHVTVVGQSMLGDAWMGSHLSNDDLVKETHLGRDYDVALTKSEPATVGNLQGTRHLLTLTPRPTAPVAWGRIDYELLEAGDLVLPLRAAYYRKAKDAQPARTITFGDMAPLGGRTVPTTLTVTVAKKPGEYTRLTYTALKFDVAIPDAKFTEQALRK